MDEYVFVVEGLEGLEDVKGRPEKINKAARQAINRTLSRTRTRSARKIRKQVNFPARYLSGQNGRLLIKEMATDKKLQGIVGGKERPTSLARFASSRTPGKGGVRVSVKTGSSQLMSKAFLIRLPQGSTLTDTQFNLGLAIRLRDGERVQNKKHMVRLSKGLYLLYGPSVNQVFAQVAEDESDDAADFLEAEFLRLVGL